MKYFFLIAVLLSCKSGPGKSVTSHVSEDPTSQISTKRDTLSIDVHDPFETGKDTIRLNAVMNKIFKFPEVEAINKQISEASKGRHGVAIIVSDKFNDDTAYYNFKVGDNSHEDRYSNIYNFLLEKKTGQIKVYDPVTDSIMSLKDWRKTRN